MQALAIMYHDVVEGTAYDSSGFPGAGANVYKMERAVFHRHLEAIRDSGAGPLVGVLRRDEEWTGRPVFLTFDDGGVGAYSHIAGMLEAFGWRGHFFITTNRIGTAGFLSTGQIRELARRGHVIGSHSHTHPVRMSHIAWVSMVEEWAESVRRLEDLLGERVKVASVPGGYYSRLVGRAASQCGIEVLFTSEPTATAERLEDCLVIGRFPVWRRMPPQVSGDLAAGKAMPRLKQAVLWKVKKGVKLVGGEAYLALRAAILARRGR